MGAHALADVIARPLKEIVTRPSGSDRWMVWAPDMQEPKRVTVGHCVPTLQQMDFAIRLGRRLNKDVAHGGMWLLVWTDTNRDGVPTRLVMAWIDVDGDVPFVVDNEDSMQVLTMVGPDPLAKQCDQAWHQYREQLKEVEVSPKQMKRLALGEPVHDPRVAVPEDMR